MAGEHWYQVRFHDRKIGSLHESRSQLPSGEYVLNRSLRFSLMRHRITHVSEQIVFSNVFPYRLLAAHHETTVTHHGHRTTSRRTLPIEAVRDAPQSKLSYVDTLAFHPRFVADRDRIESRTIDFFDTTSNTSIWWVHESSHDSSSFTLTSDDGSTTHLVSSRGIALLSNLPGGISMSEVEGPLAQPWEDDEYVLETGGVSVPVNEAISDHRQLVALTLRLHANDATRNLWKPVTDEDGYIRIDLRTPHPTNQTHVETNHRRAELSTDVAVARLISEVELSRNATYANVKRLVDTLYERIEYVDISHPSSIYDTLNRKTGDCTEFADIVAAVANELGWESRIKTGLAYHESTQSFRPHSWNEIVIDGHWISADASWGQVPADASHVPFPRANILALLALAPSMRFDVVDRRYTSD